MGTVLTYACDARVSAMNERLHLNEVDRTSIVARFESLGLVVEDLLPLTPLQEGMLFHTVGTDIADLYAVQQRIEIDGSLDAPTLEAAWRLVASRHSILRTLFAWRHDGRPAQAVVRDLPPAFEYIDLADHGDPDRVIEGHFAADRGQPFPLDEPPVVRVVVFRTAADRHTMLWSQHHLTIDGWSSSVVLDELFQAHESLRRGQNPELMPARPFSDFVRWLNGQPAAEPFWREHLEGLSEPTRMVPASASADSGARLRSRRTLESDATQRLAELARSQGVSTNVVLTGALALVLGRHTAKTDVTFGVVASGRPPSLEGVEGMVGMFINTVVLRLMIDPTVSVSEWLAQVNDRLAGVLEHSRSGMVEVQGWSGLGTATTLTDTLFAHWGFAGEGRAPAGDVTYRTVAGHGRTSFPFSVTVESSDPLAISLDHNDEEYSAGQADRFLDHLAQMLTSMVDEPGATVSSLTMLGAEERAVLDRFATTGWESPISSVVEEFLEQASRTPDATAVVDGATVLTYAELAAASQRLAATIITEGGFTARQVALHLPRSAELVVAMLATMRAGAAYVPLDRHLPAARVAAMLEDSGADLVIAHASTTAKLPDAGPPVVIVSPATDDDGLDFDIPVGGSDLAYVMYTSGSTGHPKGVMVTHRGLAAYVAWAAQTYAADGPASFPLYTSPGFDLTVTSIFVPLVTGGAIVVYPDEDVRDLSVLDVFEDDAVDVVKLTPSHLALLEDRHFKSERIRCLVLGGEDLRSDAVRPVHDIAGDRITIYNEYGPTEATVGCMIHRFDPALDVEASVPIGGPAAGASIHLIAPDGSEVPPGAVGEIAIGGDAVALGYLNQPELTTERFVTLPASTTRVYRSGDLARLRRPGVLEYLGRTDDQIKVRGHRIEPVEIEEALTALEAIATAAVAVREPSPGDVRLVAYYVPEPGASVNVTEVRAHLSERLPDHMVTRNLVQVDELPLTPNGKLDRAALPDVVGEVVTTTVHVAPVTPAEHLVARLAADLLGVEHVSVGDNFFELGAHSIMAMQLIARLFEATGVRISPRVVLLNTLQQAASLLPADLDVPSIPTVDGLGEAARTTTSAFFFGPSASPLFGMHTGPSDRAASTRAVLVCPPLGWEYMRTHWTLRKVARRLALDGRHVLRFDYHGTGDSSGAGEEPTIDRWIDDVRHAVEELRQISGAESVCAVGVRLGATLASLAAADDGGIDQLVLWDPIVRGDSYLATLERMHAEMLSVRPGRQTDTMLGDELLGFPFGPERRRRLAAIDLTTLDWPDVPASILVTGAAPDAAELRAAIGDGARLMSVDETAAWDDVASTQSSLLVPTLPDRIAQEIGDAT